MNKFDLAYLAVAPVAGAAMTNKMLRHGKYKESLPAMLGRQFAQEDAALWQQGCTWVHGVSVGEVIAARAMLPLLREEFPGRPILLTTHTETGQAQARSLPAGLADEVRYFPLDLSWVVRGFLKTYRPQTLVLMETELWPNTLNLTAGSGAQIFTLNGKISERSFRGYSRFQGLFRGPLSRVTAFCMQTEGDADRMAALTGRRDNVHVTGNCKFDADISPLGPEEKAALRGELQIPAEAPVVVAGSTHPGEEEAILRAWPEVLATQPGARLLLVPRHPERFGQVWELVGRSGHGAQRLSDGATMGSGEASITLVDRMGILTRLYGIADLALVAGSFVPGIGGHNILEPAAHGTPVIFGPHMFGQPDMVRILKGKSIQVDSEKLGREVVGLLQDRGRAAELGRAGYEAWQANRGSAQRNIDVIRGYLAHDR